MHKGDIIKKVIKKSGFPIITLTKRLGMSRPTLYKHLSSVNLPDHFIEAVSAIIGCNLQHLLENPLRDAEKVEQKLIPLYKKYPNLPNTHLDAIIKTMKVLKEINSLYLLRSTIEKIIHKLEQINATKSPK